MSQNHSLSVFEILEVQVTDEKSKSGTAYKKYVCPSILRRDDGVTSVANVVMLDLPKHPLEAAPTVGKFHPVYEPRPQWDSPDAQPALIRLIPATSVPARPAPGQPSASPSTAPKL